MSIDLSIYLYIFDIYIDMSIYLYIYNIYIDMSIYLSIYLPGIPLSCPPPWWHHTALDGVASHS